MIPCEEPRCPRCGLPYAKGSAAHLCGPCLREEYPFSRHLSYGLYEGPLREAIHRFKYGRDLTLEGPLGELALAALKEMGPPHPHLLVPIPLTKGRLKERGFNQSLLIARHLSRRTGIPLLPLLVKVRETPSQTSLGPRDRRNNLKGAFALRDPFPLDGKRVLLVDDVFTTGATLSEAARTLLRAGASEVMALTLARSLP